MEALDLEQFKQSIREQVLIESQKKMPRYQAAVEAARLEEKRRIEMQEALEVTDEQETPAE